MGEEFIISLPVEVKDETAKGIDSMQKNLDRGSKSWQKFKQQLNQGNKGKVTTTFDLIDKATSKIKKITTTVQNVIKKPFSFVMNVIDKVTGPVRSIFNAITAPLRGIMGQVLAMTGLVGGLGLAFKTAFQSVQLSASMEQTKIALTTMLGSADAAKSLMKQMQDLANVTPFEFPDLARAAKQLLAFQFAAKDIVPMMTTIGDAASGLGEGAEGIDRIVRALGQMKAKGKVSGEEIMQLTEAGIPAMRYLKDAYNITAKDQNNLAKAFQKRGVTIEQAIDAILKGMNKDFGGMMAAQSKTLNGLWSTIHDTFDSKILTKFGDGLNSVIEPALAKIVDWLDKNPEKVDAIGKALQSVGATIADGILKPLEAFANLLMNTINSPEFKNATSLGGKLRILWDDVIAKPFKEWWGSTGKTWVTNAARSVGEGLSSAIMAVFKIKLFGDGKKDVPKIPTGISDGILQYASGQGGEIDSAGQSIGKAFAEGFKKNFSISAILESDIGKIAVPVLGALLAAKIIGGLATAIGKVSGWLKGLGGAGDKLGPISTEIMNVTAQVVNVNGGLGGTGGGKIPWVTPPPGGGTIPPLLTGGKTPPLLGTGATSATGAITASTILKGLGVLGMILTVATLPGSVDQWGQGLKTGQYNPFLAPKAGQVTNQDALAARKKLPDGVMAGIDDALKNSGMSAAMQGYAEGSFEKWLVYQNKAGKTVTANDANLAIGAIVNELNQVAKNGGVNELGVTYTGSIEMQNFVDNMSKQFQAASSTAGQQAADGASYGFMNPSTGTWTAVGSQAAATMWSGFYNTIAAKIAGIDSTGNGGGDPSDPSATPHSAGGRFDRKEWGTVAEDAPEYVIPTGNPTRGRALVKQAADELGMTGGQQGPKSIRITINAGNANAEEVADILATRLEHAFGNKPVVVGG